MKNIKEVLHKLKPRWYICRDVVMIIWLGYEWIIPRWFSNNRK